MRTGQRMRATLIAALAAVLLVTAGAPAVAAQAPTPIPLSRALDLLDQGVPSAAVMDATPGAQNLTIVVDGVRRTTPLPTGVTDRVIASAQKGGVPLRVKEPPAPTAAVGDEAGAGGGGGGLNMEYLIQTWAPLVLLLGLVVVSAMALRMAGGARFKQQVKAVTSTTSFEDVAGIDEIRGEVGEIVEVLKDPERFERVGAELPSGIILHGPPGTGKTLLARAVAGEAHVPFFSASGSEFVEVYSGLGSKRIRALFAAARKAAPAVVYIDEIDAVGAKRTGHASSGEREQTLDQLLTEMDGFARDPARPVVVLASTNRLDDLDPALVRSGRFDRKIAVGLPGREGSRAKPSISVRSWSRVCSRSPEEAWPVRLAPMASISSM